jgi:hypothetical protein
MSTGRWLETYAPHKRVIAYKAPSFTLDFYAPGEVKYIDSISKLKEQHDFFFLSFFIPEEELPALKKTFQIKVVEHFEHYHITKLTLNFLNYKTRPSSLSTFYLVGIQ